MVIAKANSIKRRQVQPITDFEVNHCGESLPLSPERKRILFSGISTGTAEKGEHFKMPLSDCG